jgi:Uma2 family endonuclease
MAARTGHDPMVEQMLAVHAEFEPPLGHKTEVIEGSMVIAPLPSLRHSLVRSELQRQLNQLLPTHLLVTNTVTLDMMATGERYVPDLLVVHEDALEGHDWLMNPADAELVAEIVSPSNSRHDRVVKVRGYAASAVRIYLLIDPLEESVTLFFEPSSGTYRQMCRVPFGTSVALPPPYNGKLDTGVFASRPAGTSDI